jgi:hypothetical protein
MTEPTEVSKRILATFGELPNRSILGSHLGLQIKRFFPDFAPAAYGCRNMRDFLHHHVPQVVENGRSGQDVVYSLKTAQAENSSEEPQVLLERQEQVLAGYAPPRRPIRHDLWKTFVSPNTAYRIFVDPTTSTFKVLGRGEPSPSSPWAHVESCPADVHIAIAKAFTSNVFDPTHKRELDSALGSHVWWVTFLDVARRAGLDRDWITFRRDRLAKEFERVLSLVNVPLSAAQESGMPTSKPALAATSVSRSEALRNVVLRVVGRLSQEELRSIWLPAGLVVDEVRGK